MRGLVAAHVIIRLPVVRSIRYLLRLDNALGSDRTNRTHSPPSKAVWWVSKVICALQYHTLRCPQEKRYFHWVPLRSGVSTRARVSRDLKGATAPGQCAYLEGHSPHPRPYLAQFHRPIPPRAVQLNQSGMSMGVHTFFPHRRARRCRRKQRALAGFSSTTWSRLLE